MKLQEVLTEYQYNNVGQFRAIAESLGYKEAYNKGSLLFTRNDEVFRIDMDKIRSHTKREPDLSAEKASMDRVCQFFNRDQALSPDYKSVLKNEGVDIVNWGDLKNDAKDRFTVIDHKNKICYTGKELYEYALQNGYSLDGKGTKLEKGVLSGLMDINGKPAKVRLHEHGTSIIYRKEALTIPDRIYGKKLSKQQKQDLLDGNVIVLSTKKGDILLQVDKDLNAVVVRSEKELSVPAKIGDYELTAADKYLLANGHSLDNKMIHTPEGYIITDIAMLPDKKGYAFSNIQKISETKEQQILQAREMAKDKEYLNDKLKDMQRTGKIDIDELKDKRYEQLINSHFATEHKEYLSYLKDENPDKNYNYDLEARIRLKAGDMLEKEGIIAKGTTEKELKEEGFKVEKIREQYQEKVTGKDPVPDRDLDKELREAVVKNDYEKMASLKEEGYKPSEEVIRGLGQDTKIDQTQAIVIEKLFGMKPEVQKAEEVTQAKEESKEAKVELNADPASAKVSPELDKEFQEAVEKGDFVKMSQLKEQGYQPSKELIQSLNETASGNTMIAVQKIFNLKGSANTLGDVKLAQGQQSAEKDLKRPLANTVNKMFADL